MKKSKKNGLLISRFRHKVDENCTLLGRYAVSSGNSIQKFWFNLSICPIFKGQEFKKKAGNPSIWFIEGRVWFIEGRV